MRNIPKILLAVVAILPLAACGSLGDKADTPLAAPAPAVVTPAPVLETVTVTPAVAASVSTARIDAASFLNALVESGCEIDNAEYKEVKRGGGIKVMCTKTADLLNSGVEDL